MKINIKKKYLFIICVISCLSALFVYFPLTNTDIWWHLAAAREMILKKSFLYSDSFAYSVDNPQWIDLHWLSQILFWTVFTLFSGTGLLFFKCFIVFIVCFILSFSNHSKEGALVTGVVFALLMFEMRMLVLVRPILLTILYMSIFIWCFEHYLTLRNKKYLFILIPVQILWTNSQGLFILGPLIAGCYVSGRVIQRFIEITRSKLPIWAGIKKIFPVNLISASGLILLSCLVNPYGFTGFFFPFKLFKRIKPGIENIYSHSISENIPLMDLSGKDQRYIYIYLLVAGLCIVSFFLNKKSFRWAHVFLCVAFFYLAFVAKRNNLLYALIVPPVLGLNLSMGYTAIKSKRSVGEFSDFLKKTGKYILTGCAILLLLFYIFVSIVMLKIYPKKQTISPFRVPVEAVKYLKEHPIPGNIFNSIRYGGYLIWKFYPDKKVYIDGRLIIRSEEFYYDYLTLLDDPEQFSSLVDKHDITHVVLPIAIFPQYMPLVKWLYKSPVWDLVFVNGESVVFYNQNMNTHRTLNLGSREDIQYISNRIDEKWKNDASIRREAQRYFTDFLTGLF